MNPLEHALHLAEASERDPIAAVTHSGDVVRALRAARDAGPPPASRGATAEHTIVSLGITHIVRVSPIGPLTQGNVTPAIKIDWPAGRGVVRSMFAGTLDGDPASLSRVSLRLSINGSEELVTTGEAEAFVPMIALQPANHNWLRLRDFDVSAQQRWTAFLRYEGTGGPATSTPFVLFGYARKSV